MSTPKHPCLRIAGPKCALVRENELDEGVWFLDYPNGDFEEVGDIVRMEIASVEMKAMDWIVHPPVVTLDKNSAVYKAIQLRSDKQDEKCQWGPEYMVWLNNDRQRAMLYLGNKSSRYLMSSLRVGGKYVLLPQKRTHGLFTWYVPKVVDAEVFDQSQGK